MTRECHVRFYERLRGKFPRPTHHFGMKMHTGTDAGSGLVHTIQATAANVHDSNVLGELLHGAEDTLYGDSAYHSKALQALAVLIGLKFYVCERGTASSALD